MVDLWNDVKVSGSNESLLVRLPIAFEIGLERLRQELPVRRRQVASDHVIVMDVDVVEDALIQVSADRVICMAIEHVRLTEELAGCIERLIEVIDVCVVLRKRVFGSGPFGRDATLLAFDLCHIEGSGVDRFEQPLLLHVECSQLVVGVLSGSGLFWQNLLEVMADERSHLLEPFGTKPNRRPVSLDQIFDDVRLRGAEGTAVFQSLTAEAIEVVVEHPLTVAALLERKRLTAFPAVHGSLEVVVVDAWLLLALHARFPHPLGFVEEGIADEARVFARVLDAVERHDPDVVTVLQDRVDVTECQWCGRLVGTGQSCDASICQFVSQHGGRPLASRVALVDPTDPMGTLLVDGDGADLTAVVGPLSAVEIAKRHHAGGATALDLLQHPLFGLSCQVAGVELSNRAHDAVQQHPAWRLVDVLRAADELAASRLEGEIDLQIVDAVAREAVDFVHDDEADAVSADELEHLAQGRTIGRTGTLSGVDEFIHDIEPHGFGLAHAGIALGRDGESLGFTTATGLILRADSQIDDRHRASRADLGWCGAHLETPSGVAGIGNAESLLASIGRDGPGTAGGRWQVSFEIEFGLGESH